MKRLLLLLLLLLVWFVHVTYSRHLGKANTKYCPLSSPKRECFRVCFNCHSGAPGVVLVTLDRSYRIRTYTPEDHGELFWSGFGGDDSRSCAHTEAQYTGIMPFLIVLNHCVWHRMVVKWSSLILMQPKQVQGNWNRAHDLPSHSHPELHT